jgi:hypothetical protein
MCDGAVTLSVNGIPPPYTFTWYSSTAVVQGGSPYNFSVSC